MNSELATTGYQDSSGVSKYKWWALIQASATFTYVEEKSLMSAKYILLNS